jgi:hypothetical protein
LCEPQPDGLPRRVVAVVAVIASASDLSAIAQRATAEAIQSCASDSGLLRRGACHRARIRATRWLLAMTGFAFHSVAIAPYPSRQPASSTKRWKNSGS